MRFSIITPSFQQLHQLELCIVSVADQVGTDCAERASSPSVDHIICDAGSPGIEDFRKRMLARFPATDNYRLEFLVGPDSGMYDAINKGLKRSTGDLCAYLNCDEQYLQGALTYVDRWFAGNPSVEVGFGNIVVIGKAGNYICDRTAVLPEKWHTLTSGNLSVFSAGTFFRRHSVVDRGLFFDPAWKAVGDSAWILALLDARLKMGLMRRPLASFVYSSESLSMQSRAKEERKRLHDSAPSVARVLSPVTTFLSRWRRLAAGGYTVAPHSYRIYTCDNPDQRREFDVTSPTHRWPGA
jgi:hypothetical protein